MMVAASVARLFSSETNRRRPASTARKPAVPRRWRPVSTLSSTLREGKTLVRWNVRTIPRTSVFPSLSVEDNVLTGLHLRGTAGFLAVLAGRRRLVSEEKSLATDAATIIEFVGLAHRRREAASGLPYGEQRLVELAVALAARPRVLLLDE